MKDLFFKEPNTRWKGLLAAAAILFALSGLLWLDGAGEGPICRLLYPQFSVFMIKYLGRLSSLVPFSLFESAMTVTVLAALVHLVRVVRSRKGFLRWLCGCLVIAAWLTFSFVCFWGVNHFGDDLYTKTGLTPTDYDKQDLYNAGLYAIEQANRLAEALPKTEAGGIDMPSFHELADQAQSGFTKVCENYPALPFPANRPKPLLYTPLYSYTGFTGFIFAFTGESCVSRNTYPSALPLTMTHELSHAIAVASEDEANFLGFLACLENESLYFQYSAWYHAYCWCSNSLLKIDSELGWELVSRCSEAFAADLRATNAHYRPYDGKVQEAAQQVNDAYLKFYKEEAGVESYDRAVSYYVNWYLAGCPL
ncbi:MAG: DUF3810 domain-containing protein [Firmicutes bacterium]|nr:DUF3810 domain-containing protein [Bacillota bacterium]